MRPRILLRALALLALGITGLLASGSPARAAAQYPGCAATNDGGAYWCSAPAAPPAAPPGVTQSPYPVPIGYIGDIEFWSPNRGLLITSGDPNAGVSPGLYAYDGVSWHQLSTVCGATDGRIAWAGPDEFWTISDQRAGQVLSGNDQFIYSDVSLCHFVDGQVVASYAMPLDQPDSYQAMEGAACDTSDDCWFGGSNDASGTFHLHWDGSELTEVDGPQDHEVAAMTTFDGQAIESGYRQQSDQPSPPENADEPPLLHVMVPQDPSDPIQDVFLPDQDPGCQAPCVLPEYTGATGNPEPVDPTTLAGLMLGSDSQAYTGNTESGGTAWSGSPELWAAAGVNSQPVSPQPGMQAATQPVVLRYAGGQWRQVVLDAGFDALPNGDQPEQDIGQSNVPQALAAEPGADAAWVGVTPASGDQSDAYVDRLAIQQGTVTGEPSLAQAAATDEDALGAMTGVGPKGAATAVSCPAPSDCWVATYYGWLFHLTSDPQAPTVTPGYAQDTDPSFASVITYRPPDAGTPETIEDTGVGVEEPIAGSGYNPPIPAGKRIKAPPPLITHIGRPRLLHRVELVIPFTLSAAAKVRLIARRGRRIVAESRVTRLRAGRHTLSVRLSPKRWPNRLSLKAEPASASG